MGILLDSSGKIDASNPEDFNDKVADERKTRRAILTTAREFGCEKEMLLLFLKIDKMMRLCTNDSERKDISKLGCVEMHALLSPLGGDLIVDGQVVSISDETRQKVAEYEAEQAKNNLAIKKLIV
jgi:hypothetical protein